MQRQRTGPLYLELLKQLKEARVVAGDGGTRGGSKQTENQAGLGWPSEQSRQRRTASLLPEIPRQMRPKHGCAF